MHRKSKNKPRLFDDDYDPNRTLTEDPIQNNIKVGNKKNKFISPFQRLANCWNSKERSKSGSIKSNLTSNIYDDAMACLCFDDDCPKCQHVVLRSKPEKNEEYDDEVTFITSYQAF